MLAREKQSLSQGAIKKKEFFYEHEKQPAQAGIHAEA